MGRVFGVFGAFAFVGVLVGCGSSDTNLGPREPCPEGSPGCVTTTGGGSSGNGGAGGAGGAGSGGMASNDVKGDVGVLNEPGFSVVAPYGGAATILTTSTAAMPIEAPYDPATQSFNLASVMSGPTWFYVRDESAGATGIFSTNSVVQVPTSGPVTLPVVDRGVLTTIAGTLPAPIVIDTSKAQLVIKIVRNNQPLSGVALTTPLPGAMLAYDNGVGIYTNQTKQTGPAGVVLALNVDAASTGELRELQLVDAANQGYTVQIRMLAGAASYAGFVLP